jgi:hypothetical protein
VTVVRLFVISAESGSVPQDRAVEERYGLSSGSTLGDVLAVGLAKAKVASSALVDLRFELERQKDYPFMVAVDEVNEWFNPR